MPVVNFAKRQYKLVEDRNDGLGKVPAFDEEEFQLGITFKAKYVGTLEITRPSCRAEIVTAMRKVRYEFKIKGIEKRRVNITISVDGIKVTVRKRRRRMRKERLLDEEPVVLHEHQIGRIFYVSHDSMDLKIFSYITKDNFDNQFRCSVFKAYRKSKALFVVRTIGQAFEVCHRLQQQELGEKKKEGEDGKPVEEGVLADTETDIDAVDQEKTTDDLSNALAALVTDIDVDVKPTQTLVEISQLFPPLEADGKTQPFTVEQIRVLFNQQLEHYIQETEVFKAENQLLKDQLILERNARIQAQEREKCLLQKNRELLQTIQTLANRLQTVNPGDNSLSSTFDTSNRGTMQFNPGYPNMYSTPHKKDDFREQLIGGQSVVIPAIPPPPDAETDLATGKPRMAPLAMVENSMDNLQSTVGLYWKTFDEDEIVTQGNVFDDSTSESSDEDPFLESYTDQGNVPSEKTNGWDNAKLTNGNGGDVQDIPCGKTLTGALDSKTHQHNNGVLYNGLQTLPARTENNNIFNTNAASSNVRTAIQTDF